MNYTKINSNTIDSWVRDGWQWSVPISPKEYMQAQHGNFDLLLTPTKFVHPRHILPMSGVLFSITFLSQRLKCS